MTKPSKETLLIEIMTTLKDEPIESILIAKGVVVGLQLANKQKGKK